MKNNEVEIFVEICREGAILPNYANPWDAGMDVYAAEEVIIGPGETAVVPTGIKLAIPEGYEIQVRPRSGISLNTPLRLSNSPGTIDAGYRGELGIIVTNTSEYNTGANFSANNSEKNNTEISNEVYDVSSKGNKKGIYKIKKGDRIAQIVLQVVPRIKFVKVDSVDKIGTNRGGGFGSTGV